MTPPVTTSREADATRSRRSRSSGYTMLELAIVIVIVGIMATATVLNVGGATPRHRLRTATREVGTRVNWARSIAGGAGKTFYLRYDVDLGKVWLLHPPRPDEPEDLALDDRHRSQRFELPTGVFIAEILLPDGEHIEGGIIDIEFDPLGNSGSHIVYMENNDGGFLAVQFNSLLGFVNYRTDRVEFESIR